MKLLCFLAIFYIYPVFAQIDVVIDLDWTLFYELPENSTLTERVYRVEGKSYRLADGAEEIISKWYHDPNFRVSFYSGGSYERNKALLEQIFLPNSNISFFQAAYQVRNQEDLIHVSLDEKLRFWQRFKKDLALINPNLDNIVIIEDLKNFVLTGQEKNVYWLGKTFDFAETYASIIPGKFSPTSELEWLYERRKLFSAYHYINEAYEISVKNKSSFSEELSKLIAAHKPEEASMRKLGFAELASQKITKYGIPKHWAESRLSCSALFAL